MGHIEPTSLPFSTGDAILAFSLYFSGEALLDVSNQYDAVMLRRFGYAGLTLEAAAKRAWTEKKKGDVRYYFAKSDQLQSRLREYGEQKKEIAGLNIEAQEYVAQLQSKYRGPEFLLRLACVIRTVNADFLSLWQKGVPLLRIDNPGEVQWKERTNGKIARHPGFKLISLNASDETKKHLKI
jgi:hypothetical protein